MSFNSFLIIIKKNINAELSLAKVDKFKSHYQSKNTEIYSQQPLLQQDQQVILVNGQIDCQSNYELFFSADADTLAKLNGQFQLLRFDETSNHILAVQDYLACYPLYYYVDSEKIILSNQICNFFLCSHLSLSLNNSKALEFIATSFTNDNSTLYSEIKVLAPGKTLEIKNNSIVVSCGQDFRSRKIATQNLKTAGDDLRDLLLAAVQRYGNQPCGYELSGGLDSSAVVATACGLSAAAPLCFAISHEDKLMDEAKYRIALQEKLQFELITTTAKNYDFSQYQQLAMSLRYFPDFPNSVQADRIYQLARSRGVSAINTGFGGDHLFAAKFLANKFNIGKFLPQKFRRFLRRRYFPWLTSVAEQQVLATNFEDVIKELQLPPQQEAIIYHVYHPSTATYLRFAQELASSYGINKFHPLFDSTILEFCLGLPPEAFSNGVQNKLVLRSAMQDVWPDLLGNRNDKAEFSPSFVSTLRQTGAHSLVTAGVGRFEKIVNADFLLREFELFRNKGKLDYIFVFWNLVGLELFCRQIEQKSLHNSYSQ